MSPRRIVQKRIVQKKKSGTRQGARPQTCSGFSYPIRIKVECKITARPIFQVKLVFLLCKFSILSKASAAGAGTSAKSGNSH